MASLLATRQRGDRSFERLYRLHVTAVYRYALALVGDAGRAEDVTRLTFRNAYAAVTRGERVRPDRKWLIGIAHDVCTRNICEAGSRTAVERVGEPVPEVAPSEEDIRRALERLSLDERAALVMRELEGRSYGEIAEFLGLTVGELERVVFRARRSLREQLEGSLTCREGELAISRWMDGELPRSQAVSLRLHLRDCAGCAAFDRDQKAHRSVLRSLAEVPLPASLAPRAEPRSRARVTLRLACVLSVSVVVGGLAHAGVGRRPVERGGPSEGRSSVPVPAAASQPGSLERAVAGPVAAAPESDSATPKQAVVSGGVVFVRPRPSAASGVAGRTATVGAEGSVLSRSVPQATKRYEKTARASSPPPGAPSDQAGAAQEPVSPPIPPAQPVPVPTVDESPLPIPLPGLPAPPALGP